MTVYIKKKEFVGSSTTASSSFKGSTSVSFSANLGKGTYYLRFEQENYGATRDSFRHLHSTILDLNLVEFVVIVIIKIIYIPLF